MLWEAAGGGYKPDFEELVPRDSLRESPLYGRYLGGWGRAGDAGLLAQTDEAASLGAAWYRLFDWSESPGGLIQPDIPVLSIAVVPGYRNQGVGTRLLHALCELAHAEGHSHLSLGVFRENTRARHVYERSGFRVHEDMGTHFKMLKKL